MGVYLNGTSAYNLFQEDFSLTYYVDKTEILNELVPLIELKKNTSEKKGEDRGKGPKYVDHKAAPIWKDSDGQYDCRLLW